MTPNRDPEGTEAKNLLSACQLSGKDVLELGCGNGWLTWQYMCEPGRIFGVDPLHSDLLDGKIKRPAGGAHVHFTQGMAENLPFPSQAFDLAVYSNSL